MYKVASQAGVIHSQNQGFHPRSRPAGDAQQLSSPFSELLDDANGAPPLPPKDVCEPPQVAQTRQPAATGSTQQQPPQQPADSEPAQQPAVAASAQPLDEGETIDKTAAAEALAAASLDDDQTDPAKASGDSAVTMVIALANAAQSAPEQPPVAAVIAPVTPFETQPTPEQTATSPVIAPATPRETQPAPEQPVVTSAPAPTLETSPTLQQPATAAVSASSEAQSTPQQPTAAAETASAARSETQSEPQPPASPSVSAGTSASETQSGRKQPSSDVAAAPAIPPQAQLTPAETAEAEPADPDAPMASAAGPKATSPAKVTADQNDKNGSANPNGSQINASQINRPQTADATPTSNTAETANDAHATNAGSAANEEHGNGPANSTTEGKHADSTTEGKKEHAPVTSAASRVGTQNPEPLSTPHAEVRAGDVAQAGKTSDGVQLLTMPQPADRFATVASPAAQSASAQDATAAAVPLAGLAVEIAARAQAGRNRFEIRLDPPELGRIDVRLDIDRSGQVTSRLTVERVETLDALRRDAGDLERALQQAGFKTADNGLQFALRDQSFAGRDQSLPAAAARVVIPAPELATIDTMPAGYGRMPRPGGGIDIRV